MKVNVKALAESLGYVISAIPYFIDHQGMTARVGLEMFEKINDTQIVLSKMDSEFESNLDFSKPELKAYFDEQHKRTDKTIEESEFIHKDKILDYVVCNLYDEIREIVSTQEAEAQQE